MSTATAQHAATSAYAAASTATAETPRRKKPAPAGSGIKATMKATAARAPISPRTHGKRQKGKAVPPEIIDLWKRYIAAKPNEELRNELMVTYLHLVRYNAERIHTKLPDEVDVDDLMSSGIFGLMDAIDGFDLDRGVKFETFSAPRIRGAILDELRSMDWVPRLVRSRAHKVDGARRQLTAEKGREPTESEIADQLGVDSDEFDKIKRDAQAVSTVSLSRKWFETDSNKDVREIDVLEDRRSHDPVRDMARKDLKELMCKGLSRAERLIVTLYYFEEMTMKEIGQTLDLSESRVSQMHSSIIQRLKQHMNDHKNEMATVAE